MGSAVEDTQPLAGESMCWLQVKAVLCAAMHPNICVMDESASSTARPAWNDGTGDVHLHPSSTCHPLEADKFLRPYLTYSEKVGLPESCLLCTLLICLIIGSMLLRSIVLSCQ